MPCSHFSVNKNFKLNKLCEDFISFFHIVYTVYNCNIFGSYPIRFLDVAVSRHNKAFNPLNSKLPSR